ncbi:50S ribosomal protein L18 [Oceanidesulfovibrio marinus]|uniref:Large ribosomal subunit protein uL18 n=1 Tax=Oceanidesulfovibrio marinus TaxID=370038 RepID=A0A6P1ZEI4_9BACT|nr:50S ribosomal protein L18 [Oceanidesulfovibrio marinus]QJT07665.1 50S ribosomal protein L18 [Oceanidesulfovibrio marinus]TVM32021.1 50S ribosomal protein L18 [Oceanidesulfovibrio marinus]
MKLSKEQARRRRKMRIRKKIRGTSERPRLVVFRSNSSIYAQLVDDNAGATIAASSSLSLGKAKGESMKANKDSAAEVGKDIARLAKEHNIEEVVFDRNGYIYHGRVKSLADGAREGGLKF